MWNSSVVRTTACRVGLTAVASFVLLVLLSIARIIPLHYWLLGPSPRLARILASWIDSGADTGNGIGGMAGQHLVTAFLVNFGLTWLIVWAVLFVIATKLDGEESSEREAE
jgi:hypothetical protein